MISEFIIPYGKLSDNEAFDILVKVNDNTKLKVELTKEHGPDINDKEKRISYLGDNSYNNCSINHHNSDYIFNSKKS